MVEQAGRLEAVLDRSWELQSVTWASLTWWDRMPCGKELLSSLGRPHLPACLPSPALSVVCQPPTPRRQLFPPHQLSFPSLSASPITSPHQSCSPLAWPLPPSPDSAGSSVSVFLHSDSSHSISPHYTCSSPLYQAQALFPTPPDQSPANKFSFACRQPQQQQVGGAGLYTPPSQGDGSLLGAPPFLPSIPPPSFY